MEVFFLEKVAVSASRGGHQAIWVEGQDGVPFEPHSILKADILTTAKSFFASTVTFEKEKCLSE